MMRVIAVLLAAVLAAPTAALAQAAQSAPGGVVPRDQAAAAVDPSKMGISIDRIRRELRQANEETGTDDPLRLRFTVEVYGQAPKIDLLKDFPLVGPVPYGAPTHQEVLDVLTPKEFRSPTFPIYGLAVLAAQKLSERSKKQRCEAEIEEYRRLVMAGVPVAAPRCTQ